MLASISWPQYVIVFKIACRFPLNRARSIQSTFSQTTYFLNVYCNITHHLHLGLPSGLFPSYALTTTIYLLLFFPIRATWPTQFTPLIWSTIRYFKRRKKSRGFSVRSFLQSPANYIFTKWHFPRYRHGTTLQVKDLRSSTCRRKPDTTARSLVWKGHAVWHIVGIPRTD